QESSGSTPPQREIRSPDGAKAVFVRDHNLWVRDIQAGVERQLSFDASPGHTFHKDSQRSRLVGMDYDAEDAPPTLPEAHWSPDSTRVVALQTRTVPERHVQLVESSPTDQLQPKSTSYPYLKAGDELPVPTPRLFVLAGNQPAEIPIRNDQFPNPWSLERFRWSTATNSPGRFTFLYNQRGHQVLRFLAVDAATGKVTCLVEENAATFIDYSNKTFLEFLDGDDEFVWMSERTGWNHLYLVDARAGSVRNPITRGDWVVRGVDRVDSRMRRAWIRVSGVWPNQDPYHVHLARVDLDGTGFVALTEGDGTHEIQWSPDRRHFIDTWSRVDLPPVSELRDAASGRRVCLLETGDTSEVVAERGRLPERFVAKGRDGITDIWGILHRPRGFDPARGYPVIENIYAGPHGQHVPKSFRASYGRQEELADRGFIVVQIDGMGTNWRSKRFHDVASRNLGDAGFPDRIAWLRAAAARFAELDLSRVGIYGGSAGGQNALRALLAHGDFYQAAVADCGCHDNRMDKIWWNEAWMGWPVGPHYVEQSNVTQAHRLQGKLLLTVGELDRNVDPSSTYQVVSALIKAGKPFEFLPFPGSGHGAIESDYGRRLRADFFVRALMPSSPHPGPGR
ncbi:MAG: prolyl oligopeptidase family serine peptidase, partial [Limisphaerales bacterium]